MNLLRSRNLAVLPQVALSIFPPKGGKKRRLSGFMGLAAMVAALGIGSTGAWAATCTVSSTADTNTSGTLRYCLNNFSGGDTINIPATGTITLTSAMPLIERSVTITGPGANQLTLSGAGLYPVFEIALAPTVSISGLTIANGSTGPAYIGNAAGGITNNGGSLTVSNVTFSGNSGVDGGAIESTSTLTVTGSTFLNNTAPGTASQGYGGAITINSGTVSVTNSTFSGNSANYVGGAIYNNGILTLTNNTFSGNSSAFVGGALSTNNSVTAANNIFSGNSATVAGAGIYAAGPVNANFNLYYKNLDAGTTEDDCTSCTSNVDTIASNPNLLPLGNYGGTTQTFLPQPGSPAICAGLISLVPTGVTTDQRGFPLSGATCGNSEVDFGAVQSDYVQVTTTNDSGVGSLRAAITAANGTSYGGDIDFAPSVNNGVISLNSSLPTITQNLAIIGPGANKLVISGSGIYRVFSSSGTANVTLSGLTVANGFTTTVNTGGGITNAGAGLSVLNATFSGNSGVYGGAIESTAPLTVTGSTFVSNTAPGSTSTQGWGGAISINNGAPATVTNSTFSGNAAHSVGGAIYNNGILTITNDTFAGNSSTFVGGALEATNSVTAANNIFSGNSASVAGAGIYAVGPVNANYNLFSQNLDAGTTEDDCTSCATNTNAISAANSMLTALGIYGGGTQTILPEPGSPAICGGSTALIPTGVTADQRGFSRTTTYGATTCLDLGAVETNYTAVSFVQQPTTAFLGTPMIPPPTVQLLETNTLLTSSNTDAPNGIPITLTYSGAGTLSGNTVSTASGLATYSSLKVSNTPGMNQTLGVSIPVTPTGFTPATTLTATSNDFNVIGPAKLLQLTAPSTTTAGVPFSVTVTAYDAAGNIATGYTGTVHFTSSDTSTYKTLPGNYTFVSGDAGVHVFNNLALVTSGPAQTVIATDTVTSTVTGTATLAVTKANTTVTLTPAGAAINVDGTVTFTATVAPPASATLPAPFLGTMSFATNGTTITGCSTASVNVTTGVATCTTQALLAGSDVITAAYSGDAGYNASPTSSSITQTVNALPATLSITGSPSGAVTAGTTVTFTAKLVASALSPVNPAGTVSWLINGAAIAACPATSIALVSGNWVATCTTGALVVPSAGVTATYTGDPNYTAPSPSGSLSVTVTQAQAVASLVLTSPSAPTVNQATTFTATVKPPTGASSAVLPTGSVTFKDTTTGITLCSSVPVAPGATASTAACTPTGAAAADLTAGSHTITATYTGDTNFIGTVSSGLNQTIGQTGTTVAVTSSSTNSISVATQSVTFTAKITPGITGTIAPGTAAGTVKFTSNDPSGTVACAASTVTPQANGTGTATCTATFPSTEPVGTPTVTVTAVYSGDSNFTASTGTGAQTVQNFGLAFTTPATPATTPITVTQGYSNTTDPFTPAVITMTVTSSGGYSDKLTVTCTVTSVATAKAVTDPSCSPASTTPSGATGTTVTYIIAASSSAAVGAYTVSLSATDSTVSALSQTTTTQLNVFVVGQATPLIQVSGVTGTDNIVFDTATPLSGKAPTSLNSFSCPLIWNLATPGTAPFSSTGYLTCTVTPSPVTVTGSSTSAAVSIIALTTTAQVQVKSTMTLAALWGMPLLVLLGWFGSRKSPRRNFLRFIGAILLLAAASYTVTGCGGSYTTTGSATPPSGKLANGNYLVQVVGLDQNGASYSAVVPLNVVP